MLGESSIATLVVSIVERVTTGLAGSEPGKELTEKEARLFTIVLSNKLTGKLFARRIDVVKIDIYIKP